MPKQGSKLGYACPVCGRDDGWEEAVSRSSTRKRGQKTYTLSKRRDEKERVHFNKLGSMPVEGDIKNLLMDRHEIVLPDIITDLFMKSLKECTWYRLPATLQESIFKKMAEMKKRAESRKETEVHDERMYEEWDICLTKKDYPFYEHAIKLSNLYRIGNSNPVHRMEMTFNPAKEIMRYRRAGDPLLYLDTSEARQLRVLFKYPMLLEKIKNGSTYSMIEKGSMVLNRYSEPFSDKKWMYSWIEQFWIVVYAHAVSAREAR